MGPGYIAQLGGNTIHIIKCQSVEVKINPNPEFCSLEIPILYHNKSMFMSSTSHIIIEHARKASCSKILPIKRKMTENGSNSHQNWDWQKPWKHWDQCLEKNSNLLKFVTWKAEECTHRKKLRDIKVRSISQWQNKSSETIQQMILENLPGEKFLRNICRMTHQQILEQRQRFWSCLCSHLYDDSYCSIYRMDNQYNNQRLSNQKRSRMLIHARSSLIQFTKKLNFEKSRVQKFKCITKRRIWPRKDHNWKFTPRKSLNGSSLIRKSYGTTQTNST